MRLSALAWRGLAARRLRTVLTITGIAVGVALVTGTLIANQAASAGVHRAAAELYGQADLRVRAFDPVGLTPQTVTLIRHIPGIRAAAAVSERRLTVSTLPGPDEQIFNLLVIGVDPADEANVRAGGRTAGAGLSRGSVSGALVNGGWAAAHGLGIGDELLLVGRQPDVPPLRIVGLLDDTGLGALAQGNVLVMQRPLLNAAFDVPSPVMAVDLVIEPGQIVGVQQSLDRSMRVPFVVETVVDAERQFGSAQAGFAGIAFLFALVALAVGAFMVANAETMFLAERTREIGLLRAAGATRLQVLLIFMRQGLAMGIVGSAVGVLAGTGVAALLIAMLRSMGAVLVTDLPINPTALALAFLVGLTVSASAATVPAFAAARVSPLDALRPSRQPGRSLWRRLRWLLGLELVVILIGLSVYPLQRSVVPPASVALAIGILLLGMVVAAALLQPLGNAIGRPFEWFFGAQAMLGRANLSRDRARTGLTVGALILALASIVALGTVAESARAAAGRWIGSIIPGGYAVRLSLPADIEATHADLETTSGAASVTPIVEFPAVWQQSGAMRAISVAAIDPTVFEDAGSLIFAEGRRGLAFQQLRNGGAVLVPADAAQRAGLHPGSVVDLGKPGAEARPFTVAGIIAYSLPGDSADGAYLISLDDAAAQFGDVSASLWAFVPQPGITEGAFRAALADTAQRYAAEALSAAQVAGDLGRTLDRLIGLFDVLALLAVVIAGFGVVNTLGIGVAERSREIAILRSHGMTTGQVQAMVASEAAIMGTVGGLAAIGTGLLVAWAIIGSASARDFGAGMAVPWSLLASVALLGTGIASLASLYPARVAARTSIVRSIQHFE